MIKRGVQTNAANFPILDLVLFVSPPEDGNPTLARAGGIGRDGGVSAQISCVHPAGDLGFLKKDSKVDAYCLHCLQSGL